MPRDVAIRDQQKLVHDLDENFQMPGRGRGRTKASLSESAD
jgi:hypothetical protein